MFSGGSFILETGGVSFWRQEDLRIYAAVSPRGPAWARGSEVLEVTHRWTTDPPHALASLRFVS